MPNHTYNHVVIETNTGCSKEQLALAELKTKLSIHKGEFDFEGITPMPKDLAKSFDVHDPFDHGDEWENDMGHLVPSDELTRKRWIKEYGFDNWYDWRLANWDTKWNSYDVNVESDNEDQLHVSFFTAWSCPTSIYIRMKIYCNEHNLSLDWGVSFEDDDEYYDLKEQDLFNGRWM
jgi:hypothetical protein